MSTLDVRPIAAAQTRPLRQAILRPTQKAEELVYAGDDAPDALHVGAFLDSQHVGVASIHREPKPGTVDVTAWRLRGMAVVPERRGQGLGEAMLRLCVDHAVKNGGTLLWCNARVAAAAFYRRVGFEVEGESFVLQGIGPHYLMWRHIGPHR